MGVDSIQHRPYVEKIAELRNTTGNPFLEISHPEGTLYIFPEFNSVIDDLLVHSFTSNNLGTYMGQGRRGVYRLQSAIPLCVKPKRGLFDGDPLISFSQDTRRRCPLNEILVAEQVRHVLQRNPHVTSEIPVGIFCSADGAKWTIFKQMDGIMIRDEELLPENIRNLVEGTLEIIRRSGIIPNDTFQTQFLRSDTGIVITDFEAYIPY